ncbi:MAG: hypothetical protein SWK90_15975 [Chloroflexota bacterium]|nr:hypothetical protein [Chloroflexota bacterium]
MDRRYSLMYLALIGLVASILACNAPEQVTPVPQAPSPTMTPYVPVTLSPQETMPSLPTESPTETLLPTPTQWFPPTYTPTPEVTQLAATPTLTTTASTGPLNFSEPKTLDHWHSLSDGEYECKIILHVTGGAYPYTIHHDLDVFTVWEGKPEVVFTARGCSALVHTIIVESADGQSVKHDYWIPAPWCQ